MDLQRIGVPVILSAQSNEEDITSSPGAAQIERYGQLGLIADSTGDPRAIGDAVAAFAARYDDDGVRSGLAEAREDQVDVQQGWVAASLRASIHRPPECWLL